MLGLPAPYRDPRQVALQISTSLYIIVACTYSITGLFKIVKARVADNIRGVNGRNLRR